MFHYIFAVHRKPNTDTSDYQGLATPDPHPTGHSLFKLGKAQPKQRSRGAERKPADKPMGRTSPPAVRPGTEQALLIDLLKRKKGATIEEIVEATGWQAHSVRGAISGTLKKKLGLMVTSEKPGDGPRRYRIVAAKIRELADLPRPGLTERWRQLYRAAPPKGISRPLLFRAVAYGMQVKRYGGLIPRSVDNDP